MKIKTTFSICLKIILLTVILFIFFTVAIALVGQLGNTNQMSDQSGTTL